MPTVVKPKSPSAPTLVRDGTYQAVLSNVTTFANTYGERVGFEFTISGGESSGAKVMRSTAPQLSKMSKLAQVIEGIIGRELTDKELTAGIDLDELIGKDCQILVLQSKSKTGAVYSNVERVFQ